MFNDGIDIDALDEFTHKSQPLVRTEIIRKFFNNEIDHVCIGLLGKLYRATISLFSTGKHIFSAANPQIEVISRS